MIVRTTCHRTTILTKHIFYRIFLLHFPRFPRFFPHVLPIVATTAPPPPCTCMRAALMGRGGRGRWDRTLYADPPPPPPPPSVLEFGWEVPGNLLDLVEDEKMGFHPLCLYSKYSDFSGEPIMDENQNRPNTTFEQAINAYCHAYYFALFHAIA